MKYDDFNKVETSIQFTVLNWSSQSPYLNPVEYLWDVVEWETDKSAAIA